MLSEDRAVTRCDKMILLLRWQDNDDPGSQQVSRYG